MKTLKALFLIMTIIFWFDGVAGQTKDVDSTSNEDDKDCFDVLKIDLNKHKIRLFWKSPDGEIFHTFDKVRKWVNSQGDSLIAATNAGIYEKGYIPLGLHIENGKILRPLNLKDGHGNFYLKPNGVFVIGENGAQIVESTRIQSLKDSIYYATQSGPLLVLNGKIHPAFNKNSLNRFVRNGVGVNSQGEVFLAISNSPVNFYNFATFFRDSLNCPNALYLDGIISKLYAPELNRFEDGFFAGIIGVILEQ